MVEMEIGLGEDGRVFEELNVFFVGGYGSKFVERVDEIDVVGVVGEVWFDGGVE